MKAQESERNRSQRQEPQRLTPKRDATTTTANKPSGNASIEDRLSYYKKKYGEDFAINREKSDETRGASKQSGRSQRQPDRNGSAAKPKNSKPPEKPPQSDGLVSKLKGFFKRR